MAKANTIRSRMPRRRRRARGGGISPQRPFKPVFEILEERRLLAADFGHSQHRTRRAIAGSKPRISRGVGGLHDAPPSADHIQDGAHRPSLQARNG